MDTQNKFLSLAIDLAQEAYDKGTYPCGTVIVNSKGEILAKEHNKSFIDSDATAHAEILAMRSAGAKIQDRKNDENIIMYCSAEPCLGCAFFTRYTNIKTIVWALSDPYKGIHYYLKGESKLSEDFDSKTLIEEPNIELKERSRKLYFDYFTKVGNTKVADHFKS